MSRDSQSSSDLGCIPIAILSIVAMPLVGLYFIFSDYTDMKIPGWIMLIVGIILWIRVASFY